MQPAEPSIPPAPPGGPAPAVSSRPGGPAATLVERLSRRLSAPPAAATQAALGAGLGGFERAYRTWRVRPERAAWLAAVSAVPVALILVLAGLPGPGLVLVPLAALGAAAYALRAEPSGGRRWLLLHEQGFVDVVGDHPPRVVRWEWARGPVESIMEGVGTLRVAPEGADPPARITFDGLTPLDDLLSGVDARVIPVVVARHLAAVRAGQRLVFGPLVVTGSGLERTAGGDELSWARFESVRLLAGDRLVIGRRGTVPAWFSGPVPDAVAVHQLIMELRPDAADPTPVGSPAGPAPAAGAVRAERERMRRRRSLLSIAGLVGLALLPGAAYATGGPTGGPGGPTAARTTSAARATPVATTPWSAPTPTPTPTAPPSRPPLPETIYWYGTVCEDGQGYSGAPRYSGRSPHPIYVDDNFVEGPSRWYSDDPAKVQLVACVQRQAGRVLKKCEYFGSGKDVVEDMILGRYTLTIRETRTGRVVGRTRIDGADADCLSLLYNRAAGEKQYSVPTAGQIRQALGRFVE